MKLEKVVWISIFVSIVQMLVIIYLVTTISHLNEVVSTQTNVHYDLAKSKASLTDLSTHNINSKQDQQSFELALIRQTIQQELRLYFNQTKSTPVSIVANPSATLTTSSAENIQDVEELVDSIIATGEISNGSLESLSVEIAKLAPPERRKALSTLAIAINNGQVITTN